MAHKIRECRCTFVDVGKGHHGRGRGEEHRKLTHKKAERSAGGFSSLVESGWQIVLLDVQSSAKEADFFRLGFKVLIPLIQEYEIEDGNAPFDEVEFVLPAVAKVLLFDLAIEPSREKVIDDAALWKALHTCMSFGFELAPESRGSLAPMSAGERKELAGGEVAGMRGNDVEKARFHFGVAESLESIEMGRGDIHSVRIRAVISRSSRTRRKRDASSERP